LLMGFGLTGIEEKHTLTPSEVGSLNETAHDHNQFFDKGAE